MPSNLVTLELQYEAGKFLAQITEAIKDQFKLPYLPGLSGPNGATYYVDRVEFGTSALDIQKPESYYILTMHAQGPGYEKVSGKRLRVLQKATIYLVKEQDLIQAGAAAPLQTRLAIPITVAFRFMVAILPTEGGDFGTGVPYLYIDFDEILGLPAAIEQAIKPFLPSITNSLSKARPLLDSMPSGSGFPTTFSNAGMMADEGLSRVSIVLTSGIHDPYNISLNYFWEPFFNGKLSEDLLQGKDFALALNKRGFEEYVTRTIYDVVSDPDFLGKDPQLKGQKAYLHNNSFSEVGWASPLHYHIKFHLDLPKGCGLIDIGADVKIDLFFFNTSLLGFVDKGSVVLAGDKLDVEVFQDSEISDWDKFACTTLLILAGLAARILTSALPFWAGIPLYVYILINLLRGIFALFSSSKMPDKPVPNAKKIADGHWLLEYSVSKLKEGGISLDLLVGMERHLVLRGTQTITVKKPAELQVDVYPFQFGLRNVFTCDKDTNAKIANDIQKNPASYLLASASIDLKSPVKGYTPLGLIGVQILNDGTHSNKVFSASSQQTGPGSFTVTLDFDFPKAVSNTPSYFDDAYRCIVLIQTTAGARIITFDPIKMPSASEIDDLIDSAENLTLGICQKFTVGLNQGIHIDWLVDPDPTDLVSRLWVVSLGALSPASPIQMEGPGGELIDLALADRNGRVVLSGLTDTKSVVIRGGTAGATARAGIARQAVVRQSGLRQLGSIQLPSALRGFWLGALGGRRAMLCVTPEDLRVYDTSDAQQPQLVQRRAQEGLAGALVARETVYAWGDCGLTIWNPGTAFPSAFCSTPDDRPVRAMAAVSGLLYLLTQDKLVVLDRGLARLTHLPVPGAVALAATGGMLVIAYPDRVDVLGLDRPGAPRVAGSWPLPGVYGFAAITGFDLPSALIAQDSAGRAHLLDVSASSAEPGVLATYDAPPWFIDYYRNGNLLVRAPLGASTIDLIVETPSVSRTIISAGC
jgi:hypothetical protein